MGSVVSKIKLTGCTYLDNILMMLLAIRLKESSAEVGLYNYLVKDMNALTILHAYFNVDTVDTGVVIDKDINGLYEYNILDSLDAYLNTINDCDLNFTVHVHIDNNDIHKFHIKKLDDLVIASHLINTLLITDKDLIKTLTRYHDNLDKFKMYSKGVEIKDGKKYVKSLLCKSFDDFKPLYTLREVCYETDKCYVVKNSPVVYKS